MKITVSQLALIAGGKPDQANMRSIVSSLDLYGEAVGLDLPHRLGQYIPQLAHESGRFRYDREIWGPTAAQKRYDTRTDLGNSPAADGDGKKNAGRGPIQLTGGANIAAFEDWCLLQGYNPPDFTANPDFINTDPWEGLSAIWYWTVGNPTHKSLNALADVNDIEQITKKINGGLNGYDDRLALYTRTGLVLLGYQPDEVSAFQTWAQAKGLYPADAEVDGDAGPKTRAALHNALAQLTPAVPVKSAPVTEDKPIPVKGAERTLVTRLMGGAALIGMGPVTWFGGLDTTGKLLVGGAAFIAVAVLWFRAEAIAKRARSILDAFGGAAS